MWRTGLFVITRVSLFVKSRAPCVNERRYRSFDYLVVSYGNIDLCVPLAISYGGGILTRINLIALALGKIE